MNVNINRELTASTKEKITVDLEWNPLDDEEDGLVAFVIAALDLVTKYNRLNTLSEE